MINKNRIGLPLIREFFSIFPFVLPVLVAIGLVSCSPKTRITAQTVDGSRFELVTGEKFFHVDGIPAFILGRNPVGMDAPAFDDHFRNIASTGERLVRIHFNYMPPGEQPGEIDANMLYVWDQILDAAENYRLAVLPVLDVWSNWNNGSGGVPLQWTHWNKNPFNLASKGFIPNDLFNDTPCRRLWLQRLEKLIIHWSSRRAIVAWEIFSEVDLVTGSTEERAVQFIEHAAATIRAADPWERPITASQAGINDWPKLSQSKALDFIEIHPYASYNFRGQLDSLIISTVHQRLSKYGKPVFIGESGLSASSPHGTLDMATRAMIGIQNAIWASMVSGAMNGRMLWWQDGYDQFEQVDLCSHYQQVAAPAVEFVHDVDFSGFVPQTCILSDGLMGAMIGNSKSCLGWFRDVRCTPPNWPIHPIVGQTVTMNVSGKRWKVEFFDPVTGQSIGESRFAARDGCIHIVLPMFSGSIAFKLKLLTYQPSMITKTTKV